MTRTERCIQVLIETKPATRGAAYRELAVRGLIDSGPAGGRFFGRVVSQYKRVAGVDLGLSPKQAAWNRRREEQKKKRLERVLQPTGSPEPVNDADAEVAAPAIPRRDTQSVK